MSVPRRCVPLPRVTGSSPVSSTSPDSPSTCEPVTSPMSSSDTAVLSDVISRRSSLLSPSVSLNSALALHQPPFPLYLVRFALSSVPLGTLITLVASGSHATELSSSDVRRAS